MSAYQTEADLAARLKEELVRQTIKSLEEMDEDSLLSGDDSGLKSVWEEICVQVQHEESCFWDTYVAVIDDFLTTLVDELPQNERLALWLSTDTGSDWLAENEDADRNGDAPGIGVEDIVDELRSDLLSKAADFENSHIERYLRQLEGDDGYDEEEEDDEEENEEDEDGDGDEKEIGCDELKYAVDNSNSPDYEAIFDEVFAEVCEEQKLASGSRCSSVLDEIRNALDEQGKAEFDAAIQELIKIFGVRSEASETQSSKIPSVGADGQLSVTDAQTWGKEGNE